MKKETDCQGYFVIQTKAYVSICNLLRSSLASVATLTGVCID